MACTSQKAADNTDDYGLKWIIDEVMLTFIRCAQHPRKSAAKSSV